MIRHVHGYMYYDQGIDDAIADSWLIVINRVTQSSTRMMLCPLEYSNNRGTILGTGKRVLESIPATAIPLYRALSRFSSRSASNYIRLYLPNNNNNTISKFITATSIPP